MEFVIDARKILKTHIAIIVLLLLANTLGLFSTYFLGHPSVKGLVPLFNFDTERNIPTLFSAGAILICSLVLWLTAIRSKQLSVSYMPWMVLSLVFIFLSIDELLSVHERLIGPMQNLFDATGAFHYAWIIPYGIAVLSFAIAYFRFLTKLPRKTAALFVLSGCVFVAGAIGFEMLGGVHAQTEGIDNLLYGILYTCEESCEMFGMALFLYALLSHAASEFEQPVLRLVAGS